MKKNFRMSYFQAPVAPVRDADGRLLKRATTAPSATFTVAHVHQLIICNKELELLTHRLRSLPDKRLMKQSELPYVTPCGVFSYRNARGLVELSGLLPIDIDHLDSFREAEDMRRALFDDPVLRPQLCFVSPGGLGVKAFVPYRVPSGDDALRRASECIGWAMEYVNTFYGFSGGNAVKGVDASGKDLARTCFLCHAPGALLRQDD